MYLYDYDMFGYDIVKKAVSSKNKNVNNIIAIRAFIKNFNGPLKESQEWKA